MALFPVRKEMPSGTDLRTCNVCFIKWLLKWYAQCSFAKTGRAFRDTIPHNHMKGLAVPEMKTKNSEDVCHQDPTLSSGTALQKERACLQLQASQLPFWNSLTCAKQSPNMCSDRQCAKLDHHTEKSLNENGLNENAESHPKQLLYTFNQSWC